MESIRWKHGFLELLDQRQLPHQTIWIQATTHTDVVIAIREMIVRGAPAIAIAAAYGMAMAIANGANRTQASQELLDARPTAVNLQWALERLKSIPDAEILEESLKIHQEDLQINYAIGHNGAALLGSNTGVITICNTGALATSGHGTALGMIRTAHQNGQNIHVYILETRPYLQGARLTAYECMQEGIPCTLITDNMAGALLQSGKVQAAVAGCDRVAANGDTANKIGTYQLAVLCKHHNVPFYIAMPTSTFDADCPNGNAIPIEERPSEEVRSLHGVQIAPNDIPVWNPSFDVTPAALIQGWVTEEGIWQLPLSNA